MRAQIVGWDQHGDSRAQAHHFSAFLGGLRSLRELAPPSIEFWRIQLHFKQRAKQSMPDHLPHFFQRVGQTQLVHHRQDETDNIENRD